MNDPTRRYREVQVKTAAQDDLLLLLVEGGVRFCEGALLELDKGKEQDIERRHDQLLRAQKIVLELMGALSPGIGLELYERLMGLYRFTFERLFEGNLEASREKVEEGTRVMRRIRDLWRDAIEKAKAEREGGPPRAAGNSSISVRG